MDATTINGDEIFSTTQIFGKIMGNTYIGFPMRDRKGNIHQVYIYELFYINPVKLK